MPVRSASEVLDVVKEHVRKTHFLVYEWGDHEILRMEDGTMEVLLTFKQHGGRSESRCFIVDGDRVVEDVRVLRRR